MPQKETADIINETKITAAELFQSAQPPAERLNLLLQKRMYLQG